MKYIKYAIVLILLLVFHLILSSWWLITAWVCLGLFLPAILKNVRFPLLVVLIGELLIGLFFWLIVWDNNGMLTNLALNFQFPTIMLALLAIGVNTLTAFFCIGASLYIRNWIAPAVSR